MYTSVLDIVRMKIAVDVKVPKDAANDAGVSISVFAESSMNDINAAPTLTAIQ